MYTFVLSLAALFALPNALYQMVFYKKYRMSFLRRFGRGFPLVKKGDRCLIWIHAVSVGEVKAAAPLVKELKQRADRPLILVSIVTETGFAEAERSLSDADYQVFLPFDFKWIVNRIVKKVAPDLVILCETDYWYNFLLACKRQGAKLAVVNGKISERSKQRFLRFNYFSKKLFDLIDLFCLQSSHYKKRFVELGISEDKIRVTGNLKLDFINTPMCESESIDWKQRLGIEPGELVLTIGSTHHPEEKLIIDSLRSVWSKFPCLKVIIVPRHPERFQDVAALLNQEGILFARYSENRKGSFRVLLMDAMGLLQKCYQISDVAIVAGSYTSKVGGHNILEPCRYGVPVIFGPFMHSQPEFLHLIEAYNAGIRTAPESLSGCLIDLFSSEEGRQVVGNAGRRLVDELGGATTKTVGALSTL